MPEEPSQGKKPFWQKELFSLSWSQSFLLEGKSLFPSCILGMSHRQLLHNQDTSSLSTNLRTALPKKYLLTFHYFYSLKYQAASFWKFHDMKNMWLITGTDIHTWA